MFSCSPGSDRGRGADRAGDRGVRHGGLHGLWPHPRQDARLQGHHPHRLLLLLRRHGHLHIHLQIPENWTRLLHLGFARVTYQFKESPNAECFQSQLLHDGLPAAGVRVCSGDHLPGVGGHLQRPPQRLRPGQDHHDRCIRGTVQEWWCRCSGSSVPCSASTSTGSPTTGSQTPAWPPYWL